MTTYLGKSCSFCLPRVSFVNCRQFMYLVISLLVLRAGCGIWLYQFLIIAYLFTFDPKRHVILCQEKFRTQRWANVWNVFGPTYQCYMSNMSYVGATFRQHVGPTMAQRANLRWANVVCQRWAKGVANRNTTLVQRYHAIWVFKTIYYNFSYYQKLFLMTIVL